MNSFEKRLSESESNRHGLHALEIQTLQVNIGLTCNLECAHCHVASSPRRKEQMDWETMEHIVSAVRKLHVETVDITGGAPEMNPHFRDFVRTLSREDVEVMVRTNLTICLEPGYEDLPSFFQDHRVHLIASLPCYLEENVDAQRGEGVYDESIRVIRRLNELGYGADPALPLDLVYNPIGPHLPPPQSELEEVYRRELQMRFGIRFTRLYAITNMPIGQFYGDLRRSGNDVAYADLLERSFNPGAVSHLMCRRQISVRWDGTLFDCDFNLALRIPLHNSAPNHISNLEPESLLGRRIATGNHCFGCTAGYGSSCAGAIVH